MKSLEDICSHLRDCLFSYFLKPRTNPSIYEEGETGELVDTTIYGTDVDTDALLVFSIDWESSYAYKSGVIVDEDVYVGYVASRFLHSTHRQRGE